MRLSSCFGIMIMVSLLLTACKPQQQLEVTDGNNIRPVRYQQVFSSGGLGDTRSFAGLSQAGMEIKLKFRVPGVVDQVLVRDGENIRPKQVLAMLEASNYQKTLQEIETSLAKAQKFAQEARQHYDAIRQRYDQDMSLQASLDVARNFSEQARNEVRLASKELEIARANLANTRLLAPEACQVSEVLIAVNQKVEADETAFSIVCGEQIQVQLAMPGNLLSNINLGQAANISFEAIPERVFSGKIANIATQPIPNTQRFVVMVQLQESDSRLQPNLAAEIELQINSPNDRPVVLVPAIAVSEDERGRFVYVVERVDDANAKDLGVVKRRTVQIGRLTQEGLEVLSGLSSGDRVVTAGFSQLREGLTVRFPQSAQHYHSENGNLSYTIELILANTGELV
jgi:membrane fusion protein, multidrug efflux system